MSHSESKGHEHGSSQRQDGNLLVAFLLNATFTVVEVVGGLMTNSVAILSDAVHDAGDCLTLGLAWCLQRLSKRSPDTDYTYGYQRLSSLGALTTGLVLAAGVTYVSWQAILRLWSPEPVDANGVVGLAVVGLIFNGFAVWKLHGGASLNEKMVTWHLLEDTLGWAAVLIGGLLMAIWDLPFIDPCLSLLISLFVLRNVILNLSRVFRVFLQAAPADFDLAVFRKSLLKDNGIIDVHHTHTWTLDGEHHVFSTHLVMAKGCNREEILAAKKRVYQLLRDLQFSHITVEIEMEGELCEMQVQLPSCDTP